MASINYDEIFNAFMGNVTDFSIASLSQSDAYSLMGEYLHKAVSTHYVRRLFETITLDDAIQTLTYTMKYEFDGDADREFVITAIAKWMAYEWLQKRVNSELHTSQFFGGSEQKFYSQSAHIDQLRSLMQDAYKEARFFIQDRGYISNVYIE